MLVLTRKRGERIVIGNNIVITVTEISNGRVKLGFDAPPDIKIKREEIAGTVVGPRLAGSSNGMHGQVARRKIA